MLSVGDEVVIVDFPRFANDPGLSPEMKKYKGLDTKIIAQHVDCPYWFILEGCADWIWDERWLQKIDNSVIQINEEEMLTLFEEK